MPAVRKYLLNLSPPAGVFNAVFAAGTAGICRCRRYNWLAGDRHIRCHAPVKPSLLNGLPVQAVSFAAPPSCEVVLGPRRSPSSRPRFRFAAPLAWAPQPRPCSRAAWFGFRNGDRAVLAGLQEDCPEAEVVKNVTDVNANATEALMNARRIDTLNLPPEPIPK